jgi:hypothetical protein
MKTQKCVTCQQRMGEHLRISMCPDVKVLITPVIIQQSICVSRYLIMCTPSVEHVQYLLQNSGVRNNPSTLA